MLDIPRRPARGTGDGSAGRPLTGDPDACRRDTGERSDADPFFRRDLRNFVDDGVGMLLLLNARLASLSNCWDSLN